MTEKLMVDGGSGAESAPPIRVVQSTRLSRFELLPPELRNIIYSMCIVTSTTVIRSPLKKVKRKDRPFSTFWNLLLTNKNIRSEASSWYYTFSTFVFGNNSWGSTSSPNLHAMKAFISRVDKAHLALIRSIEIVIHARRRYPNATAFNYTEREHILGDQSNATDLRFMTRKYLSHFTSLQKVKFRLEFNGPYVAEYSDESRLSAQEVEMALENSISDLLALKSMKNIVVFRNDLIPMHKVAQNISENRPETQKIFVIPEEDTKYLHPSHR